MLITHAITRRILAVALIVVAGVVAVSAQKHRGELRGQIKDDFGGVIVGAEVALFNEENRVVKSQTDQQGSFNFKDLPAGTYKLVANATGFAPYEDAVVVISGDRPQQLNIKLAVGTMAVSVTVDEAQQIDASPESDRSTLVIKGSDLDALPDDPDELAATLQVMSGATATGGSEQFFLDGFRASRLPAKRNIREIRINQNPFAAEFDRLGTNRIDIFTKPGTGKFFGESYFSFGDGRLNARDPFAATRAPYQSRLFSGAFSGPIVKKSSSFFFDFEHRDTNENSIIRATVLDPFYNVTSLNQSIVTPQHRTSLALRVDQQLNNSNTLVARISYFAQTAENSGVGGFSLASRAYDATEREYRIQLTETAVLSKNMIAETRFQFSRDRFKQNGENTSPTINVLDAFVDGSSVLDQSYEEARWELQHYYSRMNPKHNLKGGLQLHGVSVHDISRQSFAGAFTFAGGTGVELDKNGQVVYVDGRPQFAPLTSIERYRRTLLFNAQGFPANAGSLTAADLGYGPTQFSMTAGEPEAEVSQTSFALFVQDDWRLRPNLTISAGLRYQWQSNIHNNLNLAPRFRFAWSLGQNQQRRTVIRGGIGVFYDQVGESLTLQASRFNGVTQQQLITRNPAELASFPNIPDLAGATAIPSNLISLANDARAPYVIHTALGVDHQFPHNLTVSATYLNGRALHLLRSRNINAPLPGTFDPGDPDSAVRPLGGQNNIFLYESSGKMNQQQLFVRFTSRLSRKANFFGTYVLSQANSDTDGPSTFPANSFDLGNEYGRSLLDVRHSLFVGGTVDLPWGLHLNPLVIASSGRPFNIITGRDSNHDTLFTERPAFASDLTRPGVIVTRFGAFDPDPQPGQSIIPRNFGVGPPLFNVNLRIGRSFHFGGKGDSAPASAARNKQPADSDDAWGSAAQAAASGGSERGYTLNLAVRVQNIFNHVNPAPPVGNLSSLLFGQSTSSSTRFTLGGNAAAGNRRVEVQVGFTF